MPPLLQSVTYLRPLQGPALVLTDNETWLGRNSFELSEKGQLLCSRKQACLKITNTATILECHGLNPICFVVCRSVNFQAREDTPTSRLYQLNKGQVVELAAGDKFFLVPKECLLTVGIESDCDGAADAGCLNDDLSLADQVSSPKATQLGQNVNNSPAERHRLFQTSVPARLLSTDVCVNLANRCFTGEISDRNLNPYDGLECTPDESREFIVPRDTPAPPFGLQPPLVEDGPVFQINFSTSARGDRTPGEVVIDTRRSIDASKTSVSSDGRHGPEVFGSYVFGAGDRFDSTQGATVAAGSSEKGRGSGFNNDTTAGTATQGSHGDTINGSFNPRCPAEIVEKCRFDAQEASQQITTGNVSGCTSPPGSYVFGAGDRFDSTQGATVAAGSFEKGRGSGFNNDTTAGTATQGSHGDTINGSFNIRCPAEIVEKYRSDAQEASQQITTGNVSGCTSPPFAVSGRTAAADIGIDPRSSPSARENAIVLSGRASKIWPLESSPAGEASLNFSQGFDLAAGGSVERIVCSSSGDPRGELIVENIHADTMDCRLDSRGPADLVVKSNTDAHEEGRHIISRNVVNCTSCEFCAEPSHIRDEVPSASIYRLGHLQKSPPRCGLPVMTECLEQAAASTSETITGKHKAFEILEISLKGTLEPGSSSQRPRLEGISNGLPTTICEGNHVDDAVELEPKQPELVDLTISEDEGNSQVQVLSQNPPVVESTCNNDQTGPIEGMEKVVVTVSGYEDLLRARLINLISATGASYTGSLTKMNTHVVCWKFRGAKYEMANKLGKFVVNHRWFEDCLKAGKRLPEGPYKASGELSDPLLWEQSSVRHPSSAPVGFNLQHDCNSVLSRGRFMGQAQAALVIGESRRSLIHSGNGNEYSGQSTSSLRGEIGTLDRGKRLVNLDGPASRLKGYDLGDSRHCSQDLCETRTLTGTGNAPAIDLSTPHRAQEHESDAFWNEVIREIDEGSVLPTRHSYQLLSMANHRTGLKENITGTTRHAASPLPGSSLRELDPEFHDMVRNGRRNYIANEAEASGVVQGEILLGALQSNSVVGEQSNILHGDVGHIGSYPKVFQRKRKQAITSANFKGKHRRLVRKSDVPAAADDFPSQVGRTVGIIGGINTGGQPTLNSGAPQQRASAVDTEDDFEQRAGVMEVGSAGRSGEKAGESASNDEIVCVICHSDTKPTIEGVLACGHQFCYPCIQRWADEAKSKSPTCPLCKVAFDFITFREIAKAGDNGSCTVLEERIVQIGEQTLQQTRTIHLPTLRTETLCVSCGSRDTPELLLICTNCRERACHTFCLDPPRPPGSSWYCNRCFQIHSRMQTREAYGRLFQANSRQSSALRQLEGVATLALQSRSTSRAGALGVGQSSSTPPRRGRQGSLYNFLVRQNDV